MEKTLYSFAKKHITRRYKVDRGAHAVYSLHYHLIFVVKYRRKVFTNDRIIDFLKEKIHEISETFEVEVLAIECDIDYVHILFKAKPTLNIPKYINALKTITSREVRRKFPEVKKKLWKNVFWSPSYFLATTGQVTLDEAGSSVRKGGVVHAFLHSNDNVYSKCYQNGPGCH